MAKKDYIYNKKFSFSDEKEKYTFQLKKKNWKWLWLLLLLPLLLLFIKCEHTINIHTQDYVSKDPISFVDVSMDYTAHYLYKDGSFFVSEDIHREVQTDANGDGKFEKLPCSVFSYIFYAFSNAIFDAKEDCHVLEKNPETCFFHYTWNKTLNLKPKTTDLELAVIDRETSEPLAGASVVCNYILSGENHIDSIQTDPAGNCLLRGIPTCGDITLSTVCCYGYADTTNVRINVQSALAYADSAIVRLTPLKQRFSYFVKNKFTKEPVPGATVEVILTSGNGSVIRGQSTTNVDGKGFGVYEDAFVLASLELKASKRHYKDGHLGKPYTVEQFASLPDSNRVVFLEPESYMEQFQNVDSITGVPISGVTNEIKIKSISGRDEDITEVSNRNGIFYVKAIEGDRIEINSDLSLYYIPKYTLIESFQKGEVIKLQPRMTDLVFRTIDGETGSLLPDCTLKISTSNSNISKPVSSGNGEFTVKNLYVGETISIVASKTDYGTNSTKVRNAKVIELMNASQTRRDIPLNLDLPPCDAGEKGQNDVAAGSVSQPQSYNMGVNSGKFDISYDTGSSCTDCIDIFNHRPGEDPLSGVKIFTTGQVATDGTRNATVSFSNGSVITVIVTTGPSDGSVWNYHISCPY